jgi:hypothetical protein
MADERRLERGNLPSEWDILPQDEADAESSYALSPAGWTASRETR